MTALKFVSPFLIGCCLTAGVSAQVTLSPASAALPSPAPYVVPAPPAPAQPPALASGKAGDNLEAQILNISDNRSTSGSGGVSINLGLNGPDLAPGTIIRQATVTKAVDDSGRDLTSAARGPTIISNPSILSNNSRLAAAIRSGVAQNVTTNFSLGPTARAAKSIARLEGKLEVFAPSESNGAIITVKGAQAFEGKPLAIDALAKAGVEFVLLTPEMLPEYRARAGIGAGPTPTATTVASFVVDPQNALVGFVFLDAGGQPLPLSYSSGTPARGAITFQNLPASAANGPREYQIAFYLAGGAGVVTIPFTIENIPLP